MFPIQSLGGECEVCLSHVGGLRWQNQFLVIVESAILQLQAPGGAYIWRGDLTEGFLRYRFGGLIHGGAYFRIFTARHYNL